MRKTRGMIAEKTKGGPKTFRWGCAVLRCPPVLLCCAAGLRCFLCCSPRAPPPAQCTAWLHCSSPVYCPSPPSCTACCCRDYLEEAELERLPEGAPSYLTAAVGPPTTAAPRKFCSVCGDVSSYTCTRCGSRYCGRRCHAVHTETRCLKFLA